MIKIVRTNYNDYQTLGELKLYGVSLEDGCSDEIIFECKTLELPWLNNQRNISCIPEGKYHAQKHISPKFGKSIWITDVPDRSEILIHVGNYKSDLLGCIAVGEAFKDINEDGNLDVINSRKTIESLHDLLPDGTFNITITSTANELLGNNILSD